jgi:hypothetical protein
MRKRLLLIHQKIFCIEDLGITSVNDVLNYVSILVHLRFLLVFYSFQYFFLFLFFFVIFAFLPVYSHHVFLPDLVETFPHCLHLHVFEALESL